MKSLSVLLVTISMLVACGKKEASAPTAPATDVVAPAEETKK